MVIYAYAQQTSETGERGQGTGCVCEAVYPYELRIKIYGPLEV